MQRQFLLLLGLLAPLVLASPSSPAQTLDGGIVQSTKKATALVRVEADGERGWGSSFCVDAKAGLFVTNAHVAVEAVRKSRITLVLNPGQADQRLLTAAVLKRDEDMDLAVLKADRAENLSALELGDASKLVETDLLAVFGFPFGEALAAKKGEYPAVSVNLGRVTSLRRSGGALEFIQLDAAVNPGNSGGPVIDVKGKVAGIVAAGIPGAGINFAIPVNRLRELLDRPAARCGRRSVGPAHRPRPGRRRR
jgi:S1-C subfamily serine protease